VVRLRRLGIYTLRLRVGSECHSHQSLPFRVDRYLTLLAARQSGAAPPDSNCARRV